MEPSLVQAAWADHEQDTPGVAARVASHLCEQLSLVQAQAVADDAADHVNATHGALLALVPAVALLVHVNGVHLGHFEDGARELAQLQARLESMARSLLAPLEGVRGDSASNGVAALARALARGQLTLAMAADAPSAAWSFPAGAPLAPEDQIAAKAAAAACLLDREAQAPGSLARALGLFDEALAEFETRVLPPQSVAVRALAVTGNNLAAELAQRLGAAGSAADLLKPAEVAPALPSTATATATATTPTHWAAAMLRAAHTAARLWPQCGGWLEDERAQHRLSCCLLCAGQAAKAEAAAQRCIQICQAQGAAPLELFFGFAALAQAQHAQHQQAAFTASHTQALAALQAVPAEDQTWCQTDAQALARCAAAGPR